MVAVLATDKDFHNFVDILIRFTKPDKYPRGAGIDISHLSYLVTPLFEIELVNADGVDPQDARHRRKF